MNNLTMEKIVALAKGRGFIFAGSEIYGGLANTWDYGPLGIELKNNIKKAWWQKFVIEHISVYGLESSILMNPTVWKASGHLASFSDPLMDCKKCHSRSRADVIIDNFNIKNKIDLSSAGWSNEEMEAYIEKNNIKCPVCGNSEFTKIRNFNLMFKTFQGVTEESESTIYLRPETAQGIFINFANVVRSCRARIPFGIAQIGKSFRNEITPGNFIFRTREFEQMELEFFCSPDTDEYWFEYWINFCDNWLIDLGIKRTNLRTRGHLPKELSHYSKATTDFEFLFPFGWGELWGIANRTNFDLKAHSEVSGKSLEYTDPITNEKYFPYCIEPSVGVERTLLAFLCNAYEEETLDNGDSRVVLRLHNALAPYKIAILPLQKSLEAKARDIYERLIKKFSSTFDVSGSIGKRYRRQDEIGTPYCLTVDFDTLQDDSVTIRMRDSMLQERINLSNIENYLETKLKY